MQDTPFTSLQTIGWVSLFHFWFDNDINTASPTHILHVWCFDAFPEIEKAAAVM